MASGRSAGMARIKRRADFLAAARAPSSAMPGLVLQARARQDGGDPRVGFTATRKIGNAVVRNRVRRRLRALADLYLKPVAVAGFDYVIIGRGATAERPFADLKEDLRRALARVHGHRKSTPVVARSGDSEGPEPAAREGSE
jgi:ribonuclease P protein component